MRRSLPLAMLLVVSVALPASAAREPSSTISPPNTGTRTVAFSGDHVAFGYYEDDSPTEGERAGRVEVYARSESGWVLEAVLHPDGLGARAAFGEGLAMDGDTLLVGVPGDRSYDGFIGSVRVYEHRDGAWEWVDSITAPDAEVGDLFGLRVLLDGDVAIVRHWPQILIFERDAGVWSLASTIEDPDEPGEGRFGDGLDLSGDSLAVWSDAAVRVYVSTPSGWELQKRFTMYDSDGFELSGDTLVIVTGDGKVRVYERTGTAWSFFQRIDKPVHVGYPWSKRPEFPRGIAVHGGAMVIGEEHPVLDLVVVYVYGRLDGAWVKTDAFEVGITNRFLGMRFGPGGDLLVDPGRTSTSIQWDYLVFDSIDATGCQGETPTIWGTDDDDVIVGTNGRDVIHGMDGDDIIDGRGGDDFLCGGPGNDTVSFERARRVKVDLGAGYAKGPHGDDSLLGFENAIGTKGKDVLIGDSGINVLRGLGNNDLLRGMGGDDVIDGGEGLDTTSYLWARYGVTVNLADASSSGIDGEDLLIDIEGVSGSNFDDKLIGSDGDDQLRGLAGDDVLIGGPGDDVLRGGWGRNDQIVYLDAPSGVVVDLREATVTGGHGTDRLSGVEHAIGSDFDDVLIGNSKNNTLDGESGDDFLNGRSGHDKLRGGSGENFFVPGPGNDTVEGSKYQSDAVSYQYSSGPISVEYGFQDRVSGQGDDRLIDVDVVIGSRFDDAFYEKTGGLSLVVPLAGDDTIETRYTLQVTFVFSEQGVTVDLVAGTATGEGSDVLIGVHEVVGTRFDDTMTGSADSDAFWGLEGDDTLRGGSGNDYLDGREGRDRLEGGYGTDFCINGESHSSCEHYGDQVADQGRGVRSTTARILEFMELAARYR